MEHSGKSKVLRVDVTGRTKALWEQHRSKLLQTIEKLVDSLTEGGNAAWFESQAKDFTGALVGHAKARLEGGGLNNHLIEAEVSKLYAEREKEVAETRQKHALAQSHELDNSVKSLRIALGATKVMLIGDNSEEAILFSNQIDEFLRQLRMIAESD